MRYIENTEFLGHNDEPLDISEIDEDTGQALDQKESTVGAVIELILLIYHINHRVFASKDKVLGPADTGHYNHMRKIFKHPPSEQVHDDKAKETAAAANFYVLDNDEHKLLVKLQEWVLPISPIWECTEIIADLINKAPKKLPETEELKPEVDDQGNGAKAKKEAEAAVKAEAEAKAKTASDPS